MIEDGMDKIKLEIRSGGVAIPAIKKIAPTPKKMYAIVLYVSC